jgi:hypothetical protein
MAIGYVLIVVAAPLFHNHTAGNGAGCSLAADRCVGECASDAAASVKEHAAASHASEVDSCPVCQFLSHKPAPTAEITPVGFGELVAAAASPALPLASVGFFSAWQSRAPPCFA